MDDKHSRDRKKKSDFLPNEEKGKMYLYHLDKFARFS